jgi:uncharacterized protein (TIRG00374 family)
MNVHSLRRKLLFSVVLAAVVFGALIAYGDARQIGTALEEFRWELAPLILAIAFGNYFFRFLKWQYYLRRVGVQGLAARDSFLIYMSGLGMTITPGKVGEWLKCYLLREIHGTSITRSTPILLAERLTDALALLVLSVVGIIAFESGTWPLVAVVVAGAGIVVALSRHRGTTDRLVAGSRRLPVVGRFAPEIDEMSKSNYLLMDPIGVVLMTGVSIVAWLTQVVAFYLVLVGLGVDGGGDTMVKASFILPISTLAAGLLLIPGGLGVAETGITSLAVRLLDLGRGTASTATLLVRLATLWFAVVLGLIAFIIVMRRIGPEPTEASEERTDPRLVPTSDPAR